MDRRIFLFALAAWAGPIGRSAHAQGRAADRTVLDALSAYLNGLGTVRSDFVQTNADSSQSSGVVTIRQPGRARFEYAAPSRALVLVGAGRIAIFDDASNQPPQSFPLAQTPLALLLGQRINLGDAGMVAEVRREAGLVSVVGQDPTRPEQGWIEILFAENPALLLGWTIVNAAGEETTVRLEGLRPASDVSAFDFSVDAEMISRGLSKTDD